MKHLTYLIYIILFEALVLVGPAYVVFWKGNSEAWMLLCILSLFAYSPMKWIHGIDKDAK